MSAADTGGSGGAIVSAVPTFAVVGRVNKGKSSIIATLAEDDSVRVDRRPGTTTELRRYPVRVDGQTLFVLVDTPGFEEAARALEWLRQRETSAASRPALVAELVRQHATGDDFAEERKLLQPILEGASVLYVVDGTHPYRPNYEAEMEILRWTGQPGMALINRIGEGDYAEEWRRALAQYFPIVRDFDAFAVTFHERVRLLETFRELREAWQPAIDTAVAALRAERRWRRGEAVDVLVDLLVDSVTLRLQATVPEGESPLDHTERLEKQFHDALRDLEREARRRVEELYHHHRARWSYHELPEPSLEEDLFSEATWRLFGLSPKQLLLLYLAAGAAVGTGIDAALGGATLLTGTLIGGLTGVGLWAYQAGQRLASATRSGGFWAGLRASWVGARRFHIGPHTHDNFPWIVLDRGLLHYRAVVQRTHARRDLQALDDLQAGQGLVSALPAQERARLNRLFAAIRKRRRDDVSPKLQAELRLRVAARVDELLGGLGGEPIAGLLPSTPP